MGVEVGVGVGELVADLTSPDARVRDAAERSLLQTPASDLEQLVEATAALPAPRHPALRQPLRRVVWYVFMQQAKQEHLSRTAPDLQPAPPFEPDDQPNDQADPLPPPAPPAPPGPPGEAGQMPRLVQVQVGGINEPRAFLGLGASPYVWQDQRQLAWLRGAQPGGAQGGSVVDAMIPGFVVGTLLDEGDVIVAMSDMTRGDQSPITEFNDLLNAMRSMEPGEPVELLVFRGTRFERIILALDVRLPDNSATRRVAITSTSLLATERASAFWAAHFEPLLNEGVEAPGSPGEPASAGGPALD